MKTHYNTMWCVALAACVHWGCAAGPSGSQQHAAMTAPAASAAEQAPVVSASATCDAADGCPPAIAAPPALLPQQPMRWTDEFLGQGGDRGQPVHFDRQATKYGVDTEDTVAHYDDDLGQRHVVASNRLEIYAPRFGAVRSVSDAQSYDSSSAGTQVRGARNVELAANRDAPGMHGQIFGPEATHSRQRSSGLISDREPSAALGAEGLEGTSGVTALSQQSNTQRLDVIDKRVQAGEELTVAGALVWSSEQFPKAIVTPEAASEYIYDVGAAQVHRNRAGEPGPGRIHLQKRASAHEAVPGDVIDFAISYENVGGRPLENVTIVDHLTPRLEYVADSATARRGIDFTAIDNGTGGRILQWKLRTPLAAGDKGEIRFQARVR